MRAVRDHEHRGCPRRLSTRNSRLFWHVQFRDEPILFCSSSFSTSPARLSPSPCPLGTCVLYPLRLDGRRFQLDSWTPNNNRIAPKYCRTFLVPLCDFSCRVGLQFSQDSPLQSRGLSSPPLGLGAYLYLQALRKTSVDPFIGTVRHRCMKGQIIPCRWRRRKGCVPYPVLMILPRPHTEASESIFAHF